MKDKLSILIEQLRELERSKRIQDDLDDSPIMFPVLVNHTVVRMYCGIAEPLTMEIGDYWFNGQVIRKVVSSAPRQMLVLSSYDAEKDENAFSTVACVIAEQDFSDATLASVAIVGPDLIDPTSPDAVSGDYYMQIKRASGGSEKAVRPVWQLSDASYTEESRPNPTTLRLKPNQLSADKRVRITGRYTHPRFGQLTATKDVVLKGTKPLVKRMLEIIGPDSLSSLSTNERYFLRVHYSDGSYVDNEIIGTWTLADRTAAKFSASNQRSYTGTHTLLDTNAMPSATTFRLEAYIYSEDCTTKISTYKDIRVEPVVGEAAIFPYYGKGAAGMRTPEFILQLQRAPKPQRANRITFTACAGEKCYYSYPASWGHATFTDATNGMVGGWEANPDAVGADVYVPDTVNIVLNGEVVPFFVYETSHAGLGNIVFDVS